MTNQDLNISNDTSWLPISTARAVEPRTARPHLLPRKRSWNIPAPCPCNGIAPLSMLRELRPQPCQDRFTGHLESRYAPVGVVCELLAGSVQEKVALDPLDVGINGNERPGSQDGER
jgi:hypothetical protein